MARARDVAGGARQRPDHQRDSDADGEHEEELSQRVLRTGVSAILRARSLASRTIRRGMGAAGALLGAATRVRAAARASLARGVQRPAPLVRTGAPWRAMPNGPPPWHALHNQVRRWSRAGCFERLARDLRALLRATAQRETAPAARRRPGHTLKWAMRLRPRTRAGTLWRFMRSARPPSGIEGVGPHRRSSWWGFVPAAVPRPSSRRLLLRPACPPAKKRARRTLRTAK